MFLIAGVRVGEGVLSVVFCLAHKEKVDCKINVFFVLNGTVVLSNNNICLIEN